MTKIGVVGASHMGVVWSAVLAHKGHNVTYLKSARFKIYEPDLKEIIEKNIEKGRLNYDNNYKKLNDCEVVYLAWDTPLDKNNNIQLEFLERVIDAIIPHLNDAANFVIMSQVPPGFCRKINFDKQRLFCQVDTLIYGKSVLQALCPKQIIVGCNDLGDTNLNESYSKVLTCFNQPVQWLRYEEAEIYKLSMNAMLATQIATTNTMAELCHNYNADWSKITRCLEVDRRIGLYTQPGLGIGGGHIMRDLNTIETLSRKHGFDSSIVSSAIYSSKYMNFWVLRQLEKWFGPNPEGLEIAVWGLSYKENTDSIVESPAIMTIDALPKCKFLVHDPQASYNKRDFVLTVDDPLKAIDKHTDALLVMTPHNEYREIKSKDILDAVRPLITIIDPYNILPDDLDKDTL